MSQDLDDGVAVDTEDLDALLGQGDEYELPGQPEPDEGDCADCGKPLPLCSEACFETRWDFVPVELAREAAVYVEFFDVARTPADELVEAGAR